MDKSNDFSNPLADALALLTGIGQTAWTMFDAAKKLQSEGIAHPYQTLRELVRKGVANFQDEEQRIVFLGEKAQSHPVKDLPKMTGVDAEFDPMDESVTVERSGKRFISFFGDLDDSPSAEAREYEGPENEERQPRARKPRASRRASSALPRNPRVVTGEDLNGLLLVMLLEMQEYGGGMIRAEVALYLAQQLCARSGGRFHGMNTISMAEKIRAFVEKKKWLTAYARGYALTSRGRTIARLCSAWQSGKSSGGVTVALRNSAKPRVKK